MKKIAVLFLLFFATDQLIKWWVLSHPSFVVKNYSFIFNTGPSFGAIFWLILGLFLLYFLFKIERPREVQERPLILLAFSLILSGAMSNLVDRLFRGAAIDYIHLSFFNLVFNLADVYLILGSFLYAYKILRHK